MASPSDAPRALITGLRGFTGHYLAQELRDTGYQVFGTSHGAEPGGDKILPVDFRDPAQARDAIARIQPTIVAHLAAITFVPHGDARAIYDVNLTGTYNLLEALAALPTPPRAVLLASSAQVYGNLTATLSEASPVAPASDYAVSKLAMEHMARLWGPRLPIVITRPFNYTGIGQSNRFLLPKIVEHFRRGEKTIALGNIDVARDFSDVRSVAWIYRRLLERCPAGETFNVCSGHAWRLRDILALMADIAGYAIDIQVNPEFMRGNEIQSLTGDASKLKAAIGDYTPIPLRETLEWMYKM